MQPCSQISRLRKFLACPFVYLGGSFVICGFRGRTAFAICSSSESHVCKKQSRPSDVKCMRGDQRQRRRLGQRCLSAKPTNSEITLHVVLHLGKPRTLPRTLEILLWRLSWASWSQHDPLGTEQYSIVSIDIITNNAQPKSRSADKPLITRINIAC